LRIHAGRAHRRRFKENLPLYKMTGDYHVLGIPVVSAGTEVLMCTRWLSAGFKNGIVSLFYIVRSV